MKRVLFILAVAACAAAAFGTDVETWRATELAFEAGADYDKTGADAVAFDAVFTHESGEKVSRPGFWDGGKTFRVRFAPTKSGRWSWSTTCRGDAALDGKNGALEAKPYAGSLEIYKRGFVKTAKGEYAALCAVKDRLAASFACYAPVNEYTGLLDGSVIRFTRFRVIVTGSYLPPINTCMPVQFSQFP